MNWLDDFTKAGAVWRWTGGGPHAAYRLSPHHGDFYLNTDVITSDPAHVARVVRDGLAPLAKASGPEWVIAPVTSIAAGVILAAALARHLGARLAYLDVRTDAWSVPVPKAARAIVCTDDVHGGGTLRRVIAAARARDVEVGPALALANFSPHASLDGVPIGSLATQSFGAWEAAACPLCAAGSPALDARERWRDLVCGASDAK